MNAVKNIIFDLGGVLLDIDFALTHKAFEQQGVNGFDSLYGQYKASPFFVDFEKGKIETEKFYAHIREICGCPLENEVIRDCWNALIIGFDPNKLEWFSAIRKKYRVFLFSNTNIIHYHCFTTLYREMTGQEFDRQFIKAYYSQEMGLRKPDHEAYRFILREQQLEPTETLFIDDTIKNIEAANALGFQTIHLPAPRTVLDLSL